MKYILYLLLTSCFYTNAQQMTKIIAHRGAWKEFNLPQNSLASLQKAIDLNCYGSEFDVHLTKDNVLIVFHDDNLNGKNIEDYNYEELKTMLLANNEVIPTLSSFLDLGVKQTQTKLILEIKSSPSSEAKTIKTVKEVSKMIANYKLNNKQLELILFSWNGALKAKELNTDLQISYLNGDKTPIEIKQANLDGFDYHYTKLLENDIIKEAKNNSLLTNAWTVNKWDIAQLLIQKKINYITTDYPDLFQKEMQNK